MKKILIIEDEKFLGEIYKHKLIRSGFIVISVTSAEEALDILEKEMPNLILLDILLPEKTGLDFLIEMNKNPKFNSISILTFSNYDDLQTQKKAKELGSKEYLIKSNYSPQEIVDKINKHLGSLQ